MRLLLAHQGGWDEILWFAAPITAVIVWVRWAEKGARLRHEAESEAPEPSSTMPDTDDG